MKKVLLFLFSLLLLSSCAMHNGLTTNGNVHQTQVVLSQNNFRVIANVKGESKCTYVFGIGGTSKDAQIAEAKAQILSRVDMIGKARALVNETVEVKNAFYVFFNVRTVIVTAQVVEFVLPRTTTVPASSTNR